MIHCKFCIILDLPIWKLDTIKSDGKANKVTGIPQPKDGSIFLPRLSFVAYGNIHNTICEVSTQTKMNKINPIFDEKLKIPVKSDGTNINLQIAVQNYKLVGPNTTIGVNMMKLDGIPKGTTQARKIPIFKSSNLGSENDCFEAWAILLILADRNRKRDKLAANFVNMKLNSGQFGGMRRSGGCG